MNTLDFSKPANFKYPSSDDIISNNVLALALIRVKKADRPKILSHGKVRDCIKKCIEAEGGAYEKAAVLLKEIVQKHAFASGNRRTAFLTAKQFLIANKQKIRVMDNPENARTLLGIRENYYDDSEIKEWLKNGKIREFKRD